MAANENTKFQVNYKLADGTLVNLYAKDVTDLESGLADLGMVSALIKSTASDLGGSAASNIAYATQALGATPVAQPAATPPGGDSAPTCRHGAMTFRSGNGVKGPWKGWMCAAPKGATDKCDTVWVR